MTDLFFPNQPDAVLKEERRIRAIAADLPESERLATYSEFSRSAATLAPTIFELEDDAVLARQCGQELAFPRPVPLVKLALITFGYVEWLRRKYALPGFVDVQPGDLVVDCGSYVGGFALSAARTAGRVFAFEPDRDNAVCARRNISRAKNVQLVECGLYDRSAELTLNVSANSVEHSLLQPDDGVVVERRSIQVWSLADYCSANRVERIDLLKIEAEGVELEVFSGLGDMRPPRVAIDVSPERNGQSPASQFRALLEPLGYEVRQRGQVMFARL
ncbi:FkbM family methyltransferase [Sphingomonas sp. F9_3S_D5_B_2]